MLLKLIERVLERVLVRTLYRHAVTENIHDYKNVQEHAKRLIQSAIYEILLIFPLIYHSILTTCSY